MVERSYDRRGNLTAIKDPNQGVTYYDYDRNNRLIRVTKPMGQETVYEYDAVGNRTAVYDAKGQKISYQYNALNRLIRAEHFAAGDDNTPVKTVDFDNNELGSLLSYDDGVTSATYTYDDLQRKISETLDYGAFTKTIAYTYYGNSLKQSFTDPGGVTTGYTYDAGNRLAAINIPGQGQITYNTYRWNSPTRITLPGGSTLEYGYDPLMQVSAIGAKDPGGNAILQRAYTYSPLGNITAKNTEHGNYAYGYDDLSRLTSGVNPTLPAESYSYDPLGNRLTSSATTGQWSYNINNELLAYNGTGFDYDQTGNLTRKTTATRIREFTYSVDDRLVAVEDDGGGIIADYYYDPFGRRLWKDIDGVRTYFVYSDEGLVGEYDASGVELRTYGWAPHSQWGTDPLFLKLGSQYYWYQNDHQGTPQKLITSSGRVVWEAQYDSFGNAQIEVEAISNNLRFPGQYFDAETGFYYNLNRYYDPTIGRYLRTDPFGEGLNLYAYVFNNPNTLIDPRGLCFAKGVGKAAFEMVYQVLAMVYDLEQIAYALITGDLGAYVPTSAIGQAVEGGAGTGDILVGMALGIVNVPIEFVQSLASGDAERIGSASLNLGLMIYGGAKGGYKFGKPLHGALTPRSAIKASPNPNILSGHGGLVVSNSSPITIVPKGTSVTVWTRHGGSISDALGNAIETGKPISFRRFGNEVAGARTYLEGSVIPDYTLFPPSGPPALNIMGNPTTVTAPTRLSHLLKPGMGNVNWAACLSVVRR